LCEDTYGFSALPGGTGTGSNDYNGYWWSSNEDNSGADAYRRYMFYSSEDVRRDNYYKSALFSVRCLKD